MKKIFTLLFIVLFSNCKDTSVKATQHIKRPELSSVKQHVINASLEKNAQENIISWHEYVSVSENLKEFLSISASEALNNALQLANLIKQMKDSIRPKELINSSFRTRVNVLENEALRLKDMTFINAVTSKEINLQVDKIMAAFSATNSKINTVYSQLEVEKEIQLDNEASK
jgi:ABC-type ATPase with predicted acetyltransferase domain